MEKKAWKGSRGGGGEGEREGGRDEKGMERGIENVRKEQHTSIWR